MPVESIRAAGNRGDGDTTSVWSPGVWNGFPVQGIRNGLISGFVREWWAGSIKPSSNINAAEAYWDQGLRAFGDNGASLTYFAGPGSDNGMTFASDGDNEGAGIRDQLCQVKLSRADWMFALELALETSTIADTKNGFFVGLQDNTAITATSPIAAAGTLADVNFVGFHRLEGDGDKLDLVYKADGVTQVTVQADAITLAADTEIKLGLTFRPAPDFDTSSNFIFRWWHDGLPVAETSSSHGYKQIPSAAGTDFPNDVAMGFIATLLNATGTTPGNMTLKRVRYGQMFQAF